VYFLPVLTCIQALEYRQKRLSSARVPLLNFLVNARVSHLFPITVGRFGWVFLDKQVVLAQGAQSFFLLPEPTEVPYPQLFVCIRNQAARIANTTQ
jgi:hypothetical protein